MLIVISLALALGTLAVALYIVLHLLEHSITRARRWLRHRRWDRDEARALARIRLAREARDRKRRMQHG